MTPEGRARYNRIVRFATGLMVQSWWYEIVLPKIGLARVAERSRLGRMQDGARRFRVLAIDLGGLMIKVGQFLSSRLDVLPPEVTSELEQLQDEVPPVEIGAVRALAAEQLGVPLERAYAWFEDTPIAAASLGQAHRARLSEEDAVIAGFSEVVVKVQRPGIERVVETDLTALRTIARRLSRIRFVSSRVDVRSLVEEFAETSLEEIDYLHEAVAAERFADLFDAHEGIAAPVVVWERTTRRVLTLSDVTAIKISDVAALRAAGIDPSAVAQCFAECMFEQLFSAGLFHADPHPGNVFVTPGELGADGTRDFTLTFIDFGMMGQVPESLRAGLRRVVIAVASRDGAGMVAGIQELGILLPDADTTQLERALTALFARFGGMAFGDMQNIDPREFQGFAEEFGEAMRKLPVQLPENFLLIMRAVSLTSGVCSTLDPSFNVWHAVDPFAQKLLREQSRGLLADGAAAAANYVKTLAGLPGQLDAVATRITDGSLSVDTPQLDQRLDRLENLVRRTVAAVIFAALLAGGALISATAPPLGYTFVALSGIPLLAALFPRRR